MKFDNCYFATATWQFWSSRMSLKPHGRLGVGNHAGARQMLAIHGNRVVPRWLHDRVWRYDRIIAHHSMANSHGIRIIMVPEYLTISVWTFYSRSGDAGLWKPVGGGFCEWSSRHYIISGTWASQWQCAEAASESNCWVGSFVCQFEWVLDRQSILARRVSLVLRLCL